MLNMTFTILQYCYSWGKFLYFSFNSRSEYWRFFVCFSFCHFLYESLSCLFASDRFFQIVTQWQCRGTTKPKFWRKFETQNFHFTRVFEWEKIKTFYVTSSPSISRISKVKIILFQLDCFSSFIFWIHSWQLSNFLNNHLARSHKHYLEVYSFVGSLGY